MAYTSEQRRAIADEINRQRAAAMAAELAAFALAADAALTDGDLDRALADATARATRAHDNFMGVRAAIAAQDAARVNVGWRRG